MQYVRKAAEIVSSYGFMCIILLLMLVLTYVGTIAQADIGLKPAIDKYFTSPFVIHDFFGLIPVPLPGAIVLLALFSVSLVTGGLLKLRRDWSKAGIFVIHMGILVLLVGGLVEFLTKTEGHMTLFEGETSGQFESYFYWDLTIVPVNEEGEVTQYRIPGEAFTDMRPSEVRSFTAEGLPFDVTLSNYKVNTQPAPIRPGADNNINGLWLEPLEVEKEAELNLAGTYATLTPNDGSRPVEGIVFGRTLFSRDLHPWVAEIDGRQWKIDLHKRRWDVPFEITLDDFVRELHPRTQMAAEFSSYVTKTEDDDKQKIHITMNAPLRHEGYTFYQSSWGPDPASNPPPDAPVFSTFSVVKNPADRIPMYACIIVGIGLTGHFAMRLLKYLRAESRKAARLAKAREEAEDAADIPEGKPARGKTEAATA